MGAGRTMKVTAGYWTTKDGYPLLVLTVDGKEVRIGSEQKCLYYGLDLVFVGGWLERELPVIKIPKPDGSPGELTLHGFTDDAVVVRLAKESWNAVMGDTFKAGRRVL